MVMVLHWISMNQITVMNPCVYLDHLLLICSGYELFGIFNHYYKMDFHAGLTDKHCVRSIDEENLKDLRTHAELWSGLEHLRRLLMGSPCLLVTCLRSWQFDAC